MTVVRFAALMKFFLLLCASLAGLIAGTVVVDAAPGKKRRHVVSFKFKESTTPEEIKKVEEAFVALKKKIPQIAALEWGTNNSPENLNKGFTHCFILTFKSEKDREIYLPHPEHKKFVEILMPVMADAFVIDYWAKE